MNISHFSILKYYSGEINWPKSGLIFKNSAQKFKKSVCYLLVVSLTKLKSKFEIIFNLEFKTVSETTNK